MPARNAHPDFNPGGLLSLKMSQKSPTKLLDVTIVTGLPGAGKTTVLNQLLEQCKGPKVAVLVNELVEGATSCDQIRAAHPDLGSRLIELTGGSICNELQEDLLIEVGRLAQAGEIEHLLIEASGIAEPMPLAEVFSLDLDGAGHSLADCARLDTLVTVVNAETFLTDFVAAESLRRRKLPIQKDDDRTITDVLVEQIEFSDVIVLNKLDLVDDLSKDRLICLIGRMNTAGEVIPCERGRIPAEKVVKAHRYDLGKMNRLSTWLGLPRDEVQGEFDNHEICNFVFTADRPFHPERLWELFDGEWSGVFRSRGVLWLATRPEKVGFWTQAADMMAVEWAAWLRRDMTEVEWKSLEPPFEIPEGAWEKCLGKPRQEISIVGINVDQQGIKALLHAALLTNDELQLGKTIWETFPDPFPGSNEFEEMY